MLNPFFQIYPAHTHTHTPLHTCMHVYSLTPQPQNVCEFSRLKMGGVRRR